MIAAIYFKVLLRRMKEDWNRRYDREILEELQTIFIPFRNAILQQLSPDYILAEQSASRGRKGEAATIVQSSQVISMMEKNKTPVSPIKRWWCYSTNKLHKGRQTSYPEISFYQGIFSPKVDCVWKWRQQMLLDSKEKCKIFNKL